MKIAKHSDITYNGYRISVLNKAKEGKSKVDAISRMVVYKSKSDNEVICLYKTMFMTKSQSSYDDALDKCKHAINMDKNPEAFAKMALKRQEETKTKDNEVGL